jgi:hypothetical protein
MEGGWRSKVRDDSTNHKEQSPVLPRIIPPTINTSTPLAQALISLLRGVAQELSEYPGGAVKIIIFGGCAVHLYTGHRVSSDIDAEIFETISLSGHDAATLLAEFPEEFFDTDSGRTLELNWDLGFTTTLGPLHEDYLERGIRMSEFPDGSPIHVYVAAPVDVAISKLGRAQEHDLLDIAAMLRKGLIDVEELRRLADQAIDCYVGNRQTPTGVLKNLLDDYLGD